MWFITNNFIEESYLKKNQYAKKKINKKTDDIWKYKHLNNFWKQSKKGKHSKSLSKHLQYW